MKNLLILLGVTIGLFGTLSFKFSQSVELSQNDAEIIKFAEIYIKNTENVLHTTNKMHLASGNSEKPTALLNATYLADYSKLLFEAKEYQQAIICNAKARNLCIKLLESYNGKASASNYVTYPDEPISYLERYTDKDQSTLDEWLKRVKLN